MKYTLYICLFLFSLTSCKKDQDRTQLVVGDFQGRYTEMQVGANTVLEDVDATVVKRSDDTVTIQLLPNGTAIEMIGEIGEIETNFLIPAFQFNTITLSGNGSVTNNRLFVSLTDGNGLSLSFSGGRN